MADFGRRQDRCAMCSLPPQGAELDPRDDDEIAASGAERSDGVVGRFILTAGTYGL